MQATRRGGWSFASTFPRLGGRDANFIVSPSCFPAKIIGVRVGCGVEMGGVWAGFIRFRGASARVARVLPNGNGEAFFLRGQPPIFST
jgi:hypothetical protein